MKFAQVITILSFASATTAFAPVCNKNRVAPLSHGVLQKTALFDKKGPDLDENLDEIQAKAEEFTKFLTVDVDKAREELAKNWGWIVSSGVLTMGLGLAAFLVPVFATSVAYDGTVLTTGAVGVASLISAFKVEKGQKLKQALSGAGYMGLAYYMSAYPGVGLNIITLTIATVIASEGLFETAIALKNENLEGRGWHFVSGLASVFASLWLTLSLPVSSLFAPGAALGTRLTSNGARKVAVGLAGKELADQRS